MNKKHWLRSALSLLLALCLVLGTPVAALAAVEEVSDCPAVQAVYEAEFYGPKADTIIALVNDEILPEYGSFIGKLDDDALTNVIRKLMDDDEYKDMLEDLMVEFGMEVTDANKDLLAAELCVIIRLCDDGKNDEAMVEIFRFALVELEGCSEASAPETAELYYELYQISGTKGSEAAQIKAHEKLAADTAPKDHKCDVCEKVMSECVDSNKDHKCDTCEKVLTACADADKNHKCDICDASVGDHADTVKDHKCDYCGGVMSECADQEEDGDHKCDICEKDGITYCIDADTDRECDECGKTLCEKCVDEAPADHVCDVCKTVIGTCEDTDPKDHKCDVCGKELSKCADADEDHDCDHCGKELSKCADANKDHNCDVCGEETSKCEEGEDKDHKCDVCSVILSECADANKDHECDICSAVLSECSDENADGKCDYCGEPTECLDADKDHKCDVCGDELSKCADANKDHKCDVCGEELSECADANADHKCDVCGEELTECADADKDHACDICGKELSECEDTNKDHKCEYCGERISACVDADENGKCDVCGEKFVAQKEIIRISGKERTATARKIADELKAATGTEKFTAIVYASGDAFPDALAGTYLANTKKAPILLYRADGAANNLTYIKENLAENGIVYILGGEKAVPASVEAELKAAGIQSKRLSGKSRFETNIEILKETGFVGGETVLVCTGYQYADSLSASATGMPILLVNNAEVKLAEAQIAYLKDLDAKCEFVVIGGEGAVSAALAKELAAYDADGSVARLSGKTRYETSVKLAETYLPKAEKAILAYGREFADGLCGGALGYALNAPIILVEASTVSVAANYTAKQEIIGGYVLGGAARVADATVRTAFGLAETDLIVAK